MRFLRNQAKTFAPISELPRALFVSALIIGPGLAPAQVIPVEKPPVDVVTTTTVRSTDPATSPTWRPPGIARLEDTPTSAPPPVPFDTATMMRAEDVRPGMKGYGLTVFSGLEPERFDVDIIGVRHRMMAGTDIILCRIQSPNLKELGVIAGMSGSPVYVNDKLIGAVAYGFLDVDDPLAGVTPIDTMLRVYNSTPVIPAQEPPHEADAGGFSQYQAFQALKAEPTLENLRAVAVPGNPASAVTVQAADFGGDVASQFKLPSQFTLQPLSTPVIMNSESNLTAELARAAFPSMDVMNGARSMAAAADWAPSSLAENSPGGPLTDLAAFADKISGGYALSVPFIEGDLNMAVVGTVTWRQGNRLVAFGHPMAQAGTTYAPMAAARINTIIRSRVKPFKLGEPVGHVGMIREDRLPAVGGLFGQTARMIPLSTTISDPNYAGTRQFNFRVWDDKAMAPGLIMTAIGESLGAAGRQGGDSAALYKYSLRLDDGTSITAEDYASDTDGTLIPLIKVMADAGMLMNNPFKPVHVEALDFSMEVTDRLRQASIESAALDRDSYSPGETATIEWLLRPYREEPVRLTYSFVVPAQLPDGDYDITISDSDTRQKLESRRNPAGDKIRSYEALVKAIQRNFADNRIYISLVDQDTGISVRGDEMPQLPGSIINLVQETVNSDYLATVRGNFIVDADMATRYQVSGEATVKLNIKRSLGD